MFVKHRQPYSCPFAPSEFPIKTPNSWYNDRTYAVASATPLLPAAARYFTHFFSTIFARSGKNRREKEEKVPQLLSLAPLSLTKGRRAAEG
jgi:hypothetical protein